MARKLKLEAPRLPDHDLHDEANRLKKVGGYIIGKSIGEGSFAKVKEAIHILTNMRVSSFTYTFPITGQVVER